MPDVAVTFSLPTQGASAVGTNTSTASVSASGGLIEIKTNAQGIASLAVAANGQIGGYAVTANAAGILGETKFNLTNLAPVAASLSMVSGSPQSATITQRFAAPLVVLVKDNLGQPMSGVEVEFVAVTGAGAGSALVSFFGANKILTDTNGQAQIQAIASRVAGSGSVTASAQAVTGSSPITFVLTNLAPKPGSIVSSSGTPQTAKVNALYAAPLEVMVKDSLGGPMAGVVVKFAPTTTQTQISAPSILFPAGDTAVTDASGKAAVTVRANDVSGGVTVTATTAGLDQSAAFALTNEANPIAVCKPATALQFEPVANADKSTTMNSGSVTINGMGAGCTVTLNVQGTNTPVYGYHLNGAALTTTSTTVKDGDTLTLELITANSPNTHSVVTLLLDDAAYTFDVTTKDDPTPPPVVCKTPTTISFTPITDAAQGAALMSNTVTISGMGAGCTLPVSISGTGTSRYGYHINGGSLSATPTTVKDGDTLTLELTTSSAAKTKATVTLSVGETTYTFDVTTQDAPTPPICGAGSALVFTTQTGVPVNTLVHSNTVTVSGLGVGCRASISISRGAYRIVRSGQILTKSSPDYSSADFTVEDGDQITLEQYSSAFPSATTMASVTLGAAVMNWSITTAAESQSVQPVLPVSMNDTLSIWLLTLLAAFMGLLYARRYSI